jgi:hypothetical protein
MIMDPTPLHVRRVTLAGWINRHKQYGIAYLLAENGVLTGQLTGRVRLTGDERRRRAAKGRRPYYTLCGRDLGSRRVSVTGSPPTTDERFMAEAERRLTHAAYGFLAGHRVLSCERDGQGTEGFRRNVEGTGVRIGPMPGPAAPTANADAERFVRTSRAEYLDRLTLFGERRLRCPLDEFMAHSHGERNHRGLCNELIAPETLPAPPPRSVPRGVGRAVAALPPRGMSMG